VGEVVALAGIYRRLIGARIRADWQYRLSFVLYTLGQTFVAGLDLAAIAVIFGKVHALAGWSWPQVIFLYATSGISFAIADVFVSQVERASLHIKEGTFDRFLIRPLGPLFQLSTHEFALRRIGRLVQPAVVLVIALAGIDVAWTATRIAVLVVMLASGTVIFSAIWVITSSLAFWTVETQEVSNSFTYGGNYVTQYPLDVLTSWMRRLAVFLPLAFVNYLPVAWLLGRHQAIGLPSAIGLLCPVVAVIAAVAARAVWGTAIRHYRSTGS
jgi:ABC-2 type transport system permease protein